MGSRFSRPKRFGFLKPLPELTLGFGRPCLEVWSKLSKLEVSSSESYRSETLSGKSLHRVDHGHVLLLGSLTSGGH